MRSKNEAPPRQGRPFNGLLALKAYQQGLPMGRALEWVTD
jgi:hypothetical protein